MMDDYQTTNNPPDEPPRMRDEFVITNLETVRMIAEPIRMRLLERLVLEPQSVKRLATTLKVAQTKLYYHINLLEQHGLIQVVSTRIVSGIIEKQYGATARSYRIDKALLTLSSSEQAHPIQPMLDTLFDAVRHDIQQGLVSGLIDPRDEAPPEQRITLGRLPLRLSPERADELHQRLDALIKEFMAPPEQGPTLSPTTQTFHLFVACFPTATPARDDNHE